MVLHLASSILDRNAVALGVPPEVLMEKAGQVAARVLRQKGFLKGKPKVQIFCGSGGNGGDGFVLARELLRAGLPVTVFLISLQIRSRPAQKFFRELPPACGRLWTKEQRITGALLVDAILGVGQTGVLREPVATLVRKIKRSKVPVVSLDCPTQGLRPQLTIAFHATKNALNEVVVPIGIPSAAESFFGPGDVFATFPRRLPKSHKRENGVTVIVGGSRDFVGAPLFAACGAQAAGVDLVYVWVPEVNFAATRKFSPNFLVRDFPKFTSAEVPRILALLQKERATLVMGPGLGREEETQEAVCRLAREVTGPLVLDADAILPWQKFGKFRSSAVVFTPHAGELKRLAQGLALPALARKLKAVILQKGVPDQVFGGGEVRKVVPGKPILTVGGTGDLLAGLLGGLLARRVAPFPAAGLASFILARVSEEVARKAESTTPQVLARRIPKLVASIQNSQES